MGSKHHTSSNDELNQSSVTTQSTDNSCDDTQVNHSIQSVEDESHRKRKRSVDKNTFEVLFEQQLNPTKKNKKVSLDESLKAKQEEKLKYINQFVAISRTYSQFLESKIGKKGASLRVLGENGAENNDYKNIKNLKYFEGKLRPYQVEGVTWLTVLFENSVNGILADEMGLGKTIQVIALICHLYERKVNGPYLIVAPLSTLGNWESEFKKFAPNIPCIRLQGVEIERKEQMRKIQHTKFMLDGRRVQPVVLCSYQTPQLQQTFLEGFSWTYIIVDEGHRIKNPESNLSLILRALQSENRLILTGTPLQNNIKELWALFNFLMPELFKDIEGFSSIIELEDMRDKNKILENEAQTKVISTIHKVLAPFMLRREKKFVLNDLVPKREVIIYCPLTELQTYIYRAILQKDMQKLTMQPPITEQINAGRSSRNKKRINYAERLYPKSNSYSPEKTKSSTHKRGIKNNNFENDFEDFDDNLEYTLQYAANFETQKGNPKITTNEHVPVDCPNTNYFCKLTMQNITMMLKKVVNHPYLIWCPLDPKSSQNQLYISEELIKHSGKLMVLDALLPKLKAGGHKVLIFSTFTMFLDLIEEFAIFRGYNYRRLDGGTNYDGRNESINDFMEDPDVFLFLLSTRAGGLGLNLTAADTVIFMDRDWNPMVDVQAQDRCHRIGQTKPVMIYSLIAKNTVDELIVARGDMKKLLEKLVIKKGEFKTLRRNPTDELKELENLLKSDDELTKIYSNGLFYTDEELNAILDRTELINQMSTKGDQI